MPIVALQYSSSTYYNITYNICLLNNNGDELYILCYTSSNVCLVLEYMVRGFSRCYVDSYVGVTGVI